MASNKGKKAKHDDDRISNLPESILSRILSWLPIKDAVSTSILSTRWRYLFLSMFNLDVDFHMFGRPPSPHTVKSFTNFMDKLLFFHSEGRIEQFRFNYIPISGLNVSCVCGWICAALWRGVKDIDFNFASESDNIPVLSTALLFTVKTLVRLKLGIPHLMTVPVHVRLPTLKTLVLENVVFEDDDSVKRLLTSCPVLEDLSISHCYMGNMKCLQISNPSLKSLALVFKCNLFEFVLFPFKVHIVIDVPSLVYFKYVGYIAKNYSIVNMPSLGRADIDIYGGCNLRESDGLVQFFEVIGNIKSLQLALFPEPLPFLFQRLAASPIQLHLKILHTIKTWKRMGLFKFLQFSPNLQTLVISNLSNEITFPMEKVPSCVAYQLKEFKVLDFDDESSLFKMVTYILKNAKVLNKLTICTTRLLEAEEKFRITKQLLSLPRCSNKCQLIAF